MRISARGRCALAVVVSMSESYANGKYITVINVSEKLGISEIYLEQVSSLLKRSELVNSIRGVQGRYQLLQMPRQIIMYQVLFAMELSLFGPTKDVVVEKVPDIERAMRLSASEKLDKAVADAPSAVMLADLATEAERRREENTFMFYI